MRRRVRQRAIIMLPMNLDKTCPDRLQSLHADNLVIDKGACSSVRKLDTPQDQIAIIGKF